MHTELGNRDSSLGKTKGLEYLVTAFILFLLLYGIYEVIIFKKSDYRYTIATVLGGYSNSKTFGISYSYKVGNMTYEDFCFSEKCRTLKAGQKIIIKYFIADPTLTQTYPEAIVLNNLVPPEEGWTEFPKIN
jgi:hypothetical protein